MLGQPTDGAVYTVGHHPSHQNVPLGTNGQLAPVGGFQPIPSQHGTSQFPNGVRTDAGGAHLIGGAQQYPSVPGGSYIPAQIPGQTHGHVIPGQSIPGSVYPQPSNLYDGGQGTSSKCDETKHFNTNLFEPSGAPLQVTTGQLPSRVDIYGQPIAVQSGKV